MPFLERAREPRLHYELDDYTGPARRIRETSASEVPYFIFAARWHRLPRALS